jgi:hypothetical protein
MVVAVSSLPVRQLSYQILQGSDETCTVLKESRGDWKQ